MRPVIVSLGLILAAFGSATFGQADKPQLRKIIVPLDGGYIIQATSKQPISVAETDREGVISVIPSTSGGGSPSRLFVFGDNPPHEMYVHDGTAVYQVDQRTLTLRGLQLGEAKLKLIDVDKKTDIFQVEVRRQLKLSTGSSIQLQHPSKQAIAKAEAGNDKLARLAILTADRTTVQIDPLLAGETTLRLTDAAGKMENWLVQVRVADQMVPLGDKLKLQMSKKQALAQVVIESYQVLDVEPVENDPTAITLLGKEVGIAQVLLVDKDKNQEKLQIGVKAKKK